MTDETKPEEPPKKGSAPRPEPDTAPETEDPLVAWFAFAKNVKPEKPKKQNPRKWRKSNLFNRKGMEWNR